MHFLPKTYQKCFDEKGKLEASEELFCEESTLRSALEGSMLINGFGVFCFVHDQEN